MPYIDLESPHNMSYLSSRRRRLRYCPLQNLLVAKAGSVLDSSLLLPQMSNATTGNIRLGCTGRTSNAGLIVQARKRPPVGCIADFI